ncbi:hypothetical protein CDAR_96971 [Caerostris darwini]|uniref:Uncharacterized protein n=1 Tax=Caerostris darwini TaxID=1538125 RepID=A0AAV4T351_9ARAC|nr:hypothetical protein CDAR_96971 [Caerostris darwini]
MGNGDPLLGHKLQDLIEDLKKKFSTPLRRLILSVFSVPVVVRLRRRSIISTDRIVQSARSAGKSRGGCESVVRGHVHIFKYVGKLKSRELWIHVHERLTYNIPWICQQDEQTAQLLSECFTPGE